MSVMRVGNETGADLYVEPAEMKTKNTEGEKLIIEVLTDDDPRDVHISCWGGANTVASALWRIKNSKELTQEQIKKALAKAHKWLASPSRRGWAIPFYR